jgi:hypothetical protein
MKKILTILFLFFIGLNLYGQFTYSGYLYTSNGTSGCENVPVKLYKRTTTTTTNQNTSVKIFKTHNGNGNTSQYQQYPSTRSEMDKCFTTSYSNTTLYWSGTISGAYSLNFNQYTTLTSAGASVPSSGDYYSTEVTFNFTPKETGSYSFGLTSDDGGDLWLVNSGSVIEWYGGKGTGTYKYGSVSLTAGTTYSFIARMQEYGGGDGLYVYWKRPSQSGYSYQSDEIGGTTTTTSSWALDATSNTTSSGYYSFSRATTSSTEWYIQIDLPATSQLLTLTDAKGISSIVLNNSTKTGLEYHRWDLNNDSKITCSDLYYHFGRQSGRFNSWNVLPDSRIFTTSQYNLIKAGSTNLWSTYSGVTSVTINTPTSGGSSNYYIISPGYLSKIKF